MAAFDKIVVITKKTALEELVERHNTRDQARFYLEHLGASFAEYQAAHDAYYAALADLRKALPKDVRSQFVERAFLPNFLFGGRDLVVTLGPDGLVVNTAKYLTTQPLLPLNPDPQRMDGVLIPTPVALARAALERALRGEYQVKHVTMAKAELNDGQRLYAVNDLFIGQKTHVSARYRLRFRGREEDQSSSGIIVSTGAGSTGWLRSILTGAAGVVEGVAGQGAAHHARDRYRFDMEADKLCFAVREPFVSRVSSAGIVFGHIKGGEQLEIVSQMPQNGVIFSDGIEADYLQFGSGTTARIGVAEKKVHLVAG
jgi:NAD kinase